MATGEIPLHFDVVECSSEENGFESSILHKYREDGDGWQSKRHCKYPQTLILKIHHEDETHMVHNIEILCHEYKIPELVEIIIGSGHVDGGNPSSFDDCKDILHLGYITTERNERSNYQDRELKSVPIGKTADFIKLVIQQCHKNLHNPYGQVGIVGIRLLGIAEEEIAIDGAILICSEGQNIIHTKDTAITTPSITPMNTPMNTFILPNPLPISLPPHVKHELNTKTQQSLDRLETLKKERAALEDFDLAAKIKDALGMVYALLMAFKACEHKMQDAAAKEDFVEASRLKLERDSVRDAATQALTEVELKFVGNGEDIVGELSISSIRDESFTSQKSAHSIHPLTESTKTKRMSFNSTIYDSKREEKRNHERSFDLESEEDEDGDEASNLPHAHPLAGVDDAEELPTPEEINYENMGVSSDLIQKIDEIFGSYLTKCFFSKNWQLREAALAKITLVLPEASDRSSVEECAEIVCKIISRSIEDKNDQVYQSTLLLLDELLVLFERKNLSETKVPTLLSKIISDLLVKLGDSKQKNAEGAELSLLSIAHSSCMDLSYICNATTKRVRSEDSKSGRIVKARLQFLDYLIAEFGEHVAWKRVVDFAKASKVFDHKDVAVRECAKSLIITLMVLHGEEVLLSLDNCEEVSERQINEYRAKYKALLENED